MTAPAPVRQLRQTNANAVGTIEWQIAEVRNQQLERVQAEVDVQLRGAKRAAHKIPAKGSRRLSAIVSLDIAGYSAGTEKNEPKAIEGVFAVREVLDAVCQRHDGRVFSSAGDGFMLEFASCEQALAASLDLADRCPEPIRIGVHCGDVNPDDRGDLLGNTVNVAARVRENATPGTVMTSGDVQRASRGGQFASRLASKGVVRLGKMAEVLPIFELLSESAAAARVAVANTRRLRPTRARMGDDD